MPCSATSKDAMLNLKNEYTQGFVVLSDDDTWEDLDGTANVVLVDGKFDPGSDKNVRRLLAAYDDARTAREKSDSVVVEPMDEVTVETDDCTGPVKVRMISIRYLLKFYLEKSACTQ